MNTERMTVTQVLTTLFQTAVGKISSSRICLYAEKSSLVGSSLKLRPLFAFDVFQAYPSCSVLFSFSVRFRITVRITMVTAEIMPMAEASPKAN